MADMVARLLRSAPWSPTVAVIRGSAPARRRRRDVARRPAPARRRDERDRGRPGRRATPTPDDARAGRRSPATGSCPGLIDCHSHLVGDIEYAGIPATTTSRRRGGDDRRPERPRRRSGRVHDRPRRRHVPGVRRRRAARRDRRAAGRPARGCSAPAPTSPRPAAAARSPALALDIGLPAGPAVRRRRDARRGRARRSATLVGGGADLIKLHRHRRGPDPRARSRASSSSTSRWSGRRSRRRRAHGVFVAAHAHGTEGIKVAIRAGVRSIEHGSLIDDEGIAMLVASGTYLGRRHLRRRLDRRGGPARDGWPAETLEKNELTTEAQREGFRKAVAAGVRLAYGTDSGVYPHAMDAIQLGYQVRLGSDAARGAPVGDGRRGRADGLGGPGRVARRRPVRGPRGRRRPIRCSTSRSCDGPRPSSRAAGWSTDADRSAGEPLRPAFACQRDSDGDEAMPQRHGGAVGPCHPVGLRRPAATSAPRPGGRRSGHRRCRGGHRTSTGGDRIGSGSCRSPPNSFDDDPDAVAIVVEVDDRSLDARDDRLADALGRGVGQARDAIEGRPTEGQRDPQIDDLAAAVADLDADGPAARAVAGGLRATPPPAVR